MPILKKEVEYAKEIDDVAALLVGIVKDVKAGKTPMEIASGGIAKLVEAMAGVDQLDDEMKANRKAALNAVLLRSAELVDVLLPKVA